MLLYEELIFRIQSGHLLDGGIVDNTNTNDKLSSDLVLHVYFHQDQEETC